MPHQHVHDEGNVSGLKIKISERHPHPLAPSPSMGKGTGFPLSILGEGVGGEEDEKRLSSLRRTQRGVTSDKQRQQ